MNLWLWILLAILVYVYISYYYRYPTKISILQSRLNEFDFHLLQEKQPIVLEDAIKDIHQIKKAWFKWNYSKQYSGYLPEQWYRNSYKYLLIHPQEDTEVFMYPPNKPLQNGIPDSSETVVIMKLKAHHLLIVPYHWFTMIETEKQINFIGIHDILTSVLP